MPNDLIAVTFPGHAAADSVFGVARERAGAAAPWAQEVALLEHHATGALTLRGTVAGRYVDVNELHEASQGGAATGAVAGATAGAVLGGGPAGAAPGFVIGGAVGGRVGHHDERDPEPAGLVHELRSVVPRGHSAIVMLAAPEHVDTLLGALGDSGGDTVRRSLDDEECERLVASLGDAPIASRGPSTAGDAPS